jgi:hypothetical protein
VRLLLAVKLLVDDDPTSAFPYTRAFAADWCGVSLDTARYGLEYLVRRGFLVIVGKLPGRGSA